MERKALMIQLAISDSQVLNPTENILTVEELTHALQKNAGTDHQIFYKTAKAVHRGVSMQDNHTLLHKLLTHACPWLFPVLPIL